MTLLSYLCRVSSFVLFWHSKVLTYVWGLYKRRKGQVRSINEAKLAFAVYLTSWLFFIIKYNMYVGAKQNNMIYL